MRPNSGTIAQGSTVSVEVTLQPDKSSNDKVNVDKFLIQSVPIEAGMDVSDVSKVISANKSKVGELKLKSHFSFITSSIAERSKKVSRSGGASDGTANALQKERNEYREQLTRLNFELQKTKAELENVRSSGGSELRNRFNSKTATADNVATVSSSKTSKASGHSTLFLLLAATVAFAMGFYTHMHLFPEVDAQ